jgi:hypothetical protein
MKKYLKIALSVLVVVLLVVLWWRFYFVFGQGVKAGNLNFLVRKGYVFKTWEGRLIQDGFKTQSPGAIQSNEFEFSVTNDSIASVLERCSGKNVEVRYKEYLRPIPWRGMSRYIVTEVLKIDDQENQDH